MANWDNREDFVRMRRTIRTHWFILVPITIIVIGVLWLVLRKPPTTQLHAGKPIPSTGLKMNEHNWNQPGNPENAVPDLKRMYQVIDRFRRRHNRLPTLGEIMAKDGEAASEDLLSQEDWTTPDGHLKDGHTPGATNDTYLFAFRTPRPDGSPRPAFPKPGEKDVWVYTDAYVRHRQTVHPNHRSEYRPSGVYIVLWSDGSIERVSMPDIMKYRVSDSEWRYGFRGQAGLPKDAKTWRADMMGGGFNKVVIKP